MSVTHSTKQLHRLWCYASRRESGRERWAPKSVRGAGNDEQLLRASDANCAAAVPSFANPPPRSLLLAARRCWCRHGAPLALLCLALASWVRSSQRSKEDKKKKLPPSFLFSLVLHVPPLFLHLFSSLSLCVCGCVHNVGTAGLLQIGHACRKRGRKRVGPREYYEGTEREVGQRGSPPRKRIGWDGNMERKIELRERERERGGGLPSLSELYRLLCSRRRAVRHSSERNSLLSGRCCSWPSYLKSLLRLPETGINLQPVPVNYLSHCNYSPSLPAAAAPRPISRRSRACGPRRVGPRPPPTCGEVTLAEPIFVITLSPSSFVDPRPTSSRE